MLRRVILTAVVASAVLLPARAHAIDGFILGLEAGYGGWHFNTSNVHVSGTAESNGFTSDDAAAFANNTSGGWGDLNIHLGWNFFGHAALEAAIHGTTWNLLNDQRGGAGFVGARATWYPLQIFLAPDRKYDVGLELGAGYSISGGPTFGMDGAYFQIGLTGEYRVSKHVGLALNVRYFIPNWNKFYLNYNDNISTTISGVSAGWTTVTVGVNLHIPSGA